jgi:hypothetical protein
MMHFSAFDYVHSQLEKSGPRKRVLEIGARDVNGSVRRLFIGSEYVGLDVADGPGVDVVSFPKEYIASHKGEFDTVVCVETLEHDPCPGTTIRAARSALVDDGGLFIVTTASVGRKPHSGVDGGPLREGEHYENIKAEDLHWWLYSAFGEGHFEIEEWGVRDIRATAWTGKRPSHPAKAWERELAMVTFPR